MAPTLIWPTGVALLAVALSGCGLGITSLEKGDVDSASASGAGDGGDGGADGAVDSGLTGGDGADGGSGSGTDGGSGSGTDGGDGGSGDSGSGDGGSGDGSTGDGGSGDGGSGSGGATDADGDGYTSDTDCDDGNAAIHPGAGEYCDGVDNDCDGQIDADDSGLIDGFSAYRDSDGDGWGDASAATTVCAEGSGYVRSSGDCNDGAAAVSPSASEVCDDGVDNDCDGGIDDGAACDVNYVGYLVWWYGYAGNYAGDYNCQAVWDTSGERSATACPGCDFVLDIDAVVNTTYSWDDGSCTYGDFSATWAWDSDYSGSVGYVLTNSYGTWYPITSNASYTASSGVWMFGNGLLDYSYSYYWYTYYYSNYEYGYGYIY